MSIVQHTADGDDHLSVMDRKLWSLVYACIARFQCAVMFSHQLPSVPSKVNSRIEFFVPSDHPAASEVVAFLQHELANEARPATKDRTGWFWGTDVFVREFSGLTPYRDRAESEAFAREVFEDVFRTGKAA